MDPIVNKLLFLLVFLSGCGLREPLQPPPGESLPVKPAAARTAPDVDQLLTPTAEARPQRAPRLDDTSQEREQDRFDLPPQ